MMYEISSGRTIASVKPVFVPPSDVKVSLAGPFGQLQAIVFHPEEVVNDKEVKKHDGAGN